MNLALKRLYINRESISTASFKGSHRSENEITSFDVDCIPFATFFRALQPQLDVPHN